MEVANAAVAQLHADRLNQKARGATISYSVLGAVLVDATCVALAAATGGHLRLPELLIYGLFGLAPGFFLGRWRAESLRFKAKVLVAGAAESRVRAP